MSISNVNNRIIIKLLGSEQNKINFKGFKNFLKENFYWLKLHIDFPFGNNSNKANLP